MNDDTVYTLPRAIIIGPMRTGTSWVQRYFEGRDDIVLPDGVKETFFFDRHYDRGVQWYADHFPAVAPQQHVVEVAPSYFHAPEAAERISQSLGHVQLVVILRDPVERSISHYMHYRRYGFTDRPILDAVQDFPEIVDASRYAQCLERWTQHHARECIHLLHHDDLARDPERFVEVLCDSVCIPHTPAAPDLLGSMVNRPTQPRSRRLAQCAQSAADYFRSRGLYHIVNFGKAIGLKKVFFGSRVSDVTQQVTAAERGAIQEALAADAQLMQEHYGVQFYRDVQQVGA